MSGTMIDHDTGCTRTVQQVTICIGLTRDESLARRIAHSGPIYLLLTNLC